MAESFTSVLDATIQLNGNGLSATQEVVPAIVNTAAVGPYRIAGSVPGTTFLPLIAANQFAAGSWAVLTFGTLVGQVYLNGTNQGATGYQPATGGVPNVFPIGPQTVLGVYNSAGVAVDVQLEVY